MAVKPPKFFELDINLQKIYASFMFLGLIAFVVTVIHDPIRAWSSYLVSLFYFISLALGGVFFTSLQHLTKASWSVGLRRVPESCINFLKPSFLLTIVFLILGSYYLYEWMHVDIVKKDYLLQHKQSYLNVPFFFTRVIISFVLWLLLGYKMLSNSLKQDETGDVQLTKKNVILSVLFILIFTITFSIFSIDMLMSLEPHWFSTIIGVYTFAGLFQSSLAAFILILLYLMKKGYLDQIVTVNHLHDLGKFLFGFTVFWAYIAFSQFMLIWYANIPETSFYYLTRTTGSWVWVSLFLILFKFVIPFFALLPRWAKRTPSYLGGVCILILFTQYVDIYWLVYPSFYDHLVFGLSEVIIFLGFLGVFLWSILTFFQKQSLIPLKDPRLKESISHEVNY